jgi:hypothetical protein
MVDSLRDRGLRDAADETAQLLEEARAFDHHAGAVLPLAPGVEGRRGGARPGWTPPWRSTGTLAVEA